MPARVDIAFELKDDDVVEKKRVDGALVISIRPKAAIHGIHGCPTILGESPRD